MGRGNVDSGTAYLNLDFPSYSSLGNIFLTSLGLSFFIFKMGIKIPAFQAYYEDLQ